MHEPVEQGSSHHFVAEELGPGVEALVAGYDYGRAFVEIRDEGEEKIGFLARDGRVAYLVDDDEVGLGEPREPELRASGDLGAGKLSTPIWICRF